MLIQQLKHKLRECVLAHLRIGVAPGLDLDFLMEVVGKLLEVGECFVHLNSTFIVSRRARCPPAPVWYPPRS